MESVSVSHTIFAINQRNPLTIHSTRSFHLQTSRFRFRFISSYKKSGFQDFQGFAKPSRLLPSKVCTQKLKDKIFPSTFYKLSLQTSSMYGSSLSNINAGILLCLIDEKGDSILQRIPAYLLSESSVEKETLHFQRGSVDEFVFEGPELGKVQALWIGIESGQWRLGGVNLIIVNKSQPSSGETLENVNKSQPSSGETLENVGAKYDFEVDDILLGESSDESMLELRPRLVSNLSGPDVFSQPTSPLSDKIRIEKSMKEYADLKISLLLYDAILIVGGTSFASFSLGENSAFAFLLGGIIGFLYLLLLQTSVDGLPASEIIISKDDNPASASASASEIIISKDDNPASASASEIISKDDNPASASEIISKDDNPASASASASASEIISKDEMVRYRGPVSALALAVALSSLAIKYSMGEVPFALTPKQLLVGMMGFLACKVAVLLAAFKPLPVTIEEKK